MKPINMQRMFISIYFLFIITILNGQQSFSSDIFMGEWFYKGAEKPKVSDTILLIKDKSDQDLEYKKWNFEKSNVFDILIYTSPSKNKNQMLVVQEKKDIEDKWFFDSFTNQLKIQQRQTEQVFKIISNRKGIIRLVKLK